MGRLSKLLKLNNFKRSVGTKILTLFKLKTVPLQFNLTAVAKLTERSLPMPLANVTEGTHDVAPYLHLQFTI